MNLTSNRYVVIEGIDGCGKDTLLDSLWPRLILDRWIATAEPAHTIKWREDSHSVKTIASQTATAEAMNALHDAIRVMLRSGVSATVAFQRWSESRLGSQPLLLSMFLENRMLQDTLITAVSAAVAGDLNRIQVRSFISTAVYNHTGSVEAALQHCVDYGVTVPTDVVFLDIDPKLASRRIDKRGQAAEVFEVAEKLEQKRGYYRQARAWVGREFPKVHWHDVVVTEADTPASVAARVGRLIGAP